MSYSCNDACECRNPLEHASTGRIVLDANEVMVAGLSAPAKKAYREIVELYGQALERSYDKVEIRPQMLELLKQCPPETLTRFRAAVDEGILVLQKAGAMCVILGVLEWL